MIDNPIIIGCGTIGSILSFELAKSKLVSKLTIYDFDIISDFDNEEYYPFIPQESGLLKVEVCEFYCKYLNPKMKIIAREEKRIKLFEEGFIIDCRDNKDEIIKPNICISSDAHMLYIDSSEMKEVHKDYSRYLTPRNKKFLNNAVKLILDYLKKDFYLYKDLRFYDLRNNQCHICK